MQLLWPGHSVYRNQEDTSLAFKELRAPEGLSVGRVTALGGKSPVKEGMWESTRCYQNGDTRVPDACLWGKEGVLKLHLEGREFARTGGGRHSRSQKAQAPEAESW